MRSWNKTSAFLKGYLFAFNNPAHVKSGNDKTEHTERDAQAQYDMGMIYYNGEGVPKSKTEAAKWFKLAAK